MVNYSKSNMFVLGTTSVTCFLYVWHLIRINMRYKRYTHYNYLVVRKINKGVPRKLNHSPKGSRTFEVSWEIVNLTTNQSQHHSCRCPSAFVTGTSAGIIMIFFCNHDYTGSTLCWTRSNLMNWTLCGLVQFLRNPLSNIWKHWTIPLKTWTIH